jgi:WW domain-binding protein 4
VKPTTTTTTTTRTSLKVPLTPAPPRKPPAKPSNPYTNYTTAAFLGYKDPDAERLQAEVDRRRTQGVAGDWEVVVPTAAPAAEAATPGSSSGAADAGPSLKRDLAAEIDEENSRHFKLQKKTLGGGLGEIYDPGIIPIKLKKKDEPLGTEESAPPGPAAPKWTKVQWKRADPDFENPPESHDKEKTSGGAELDTQATLTMKPEDHSSVSGLPSEPDNKEDTPVKAEDIPPALEGGSSSLFRKRKTPAGTGRGKRQM